MSFHQAPDIKSCYSMYINNYDHTLNTLKELESNKKFTKLLEDISNERKCDLMSLSIAPVQRLPRYELFFRELLKNTDRKSP